MAHYTEGGPAGFSIPNVRCVNRNTKAICCYWAGKERWVPLDAIHDDSDVWKPSQTGTLIVKRWWAEQEGLVS
jgi:hypothetical protein